MSYAPFDAIQIGIASPAVDGGFVFDADLTAYYGEVEGHRAVGHTAVAHEAVLSKRLGIFLQLEVTD